MLIGEVARRTGVPPHTLRFYEEQHLLTRPARRESGYRVYSDRVLSELGFIRRAQQLGFTLDDVREILTLGRRGTVPCGRVAAICATHLERIERQMAELQAFRQGLQKVARQATNGCGLTVEGFCRAIAGQDQPRG
jgi:MerR family mercuric resistance operon transcriptional regulator